MDLEAAETDHLRPPRDQITFRKTIWKCPCNGCVKAAKREREAIADELMEAGFEDAANYIMKDKNEKK